jgi:hypothetical protein
MKKAIWCRGCSFTFGEGLQYFSELPSVNVPDEQYWDAKYLTNKYKFDFPENRMSQFQFMLLERAINKYEESRPITRTKEYKSRHGLLS